MKKFLDNLVNFLDNEVIFYAEHYKTCDQSFSNKVSQNKRIRGLG